MGLVGNSNEKDHLGDAGVNLRIIKIDHQEVKCRSMEWKEVAHDRDS